MNIKTALAAVLAAAAIAACVSPTASVPLRWQPPTENEDGSRLEDLAGYRVYWKRVGAAEENSVEIDDAGTTSYVIEGLRDGDWQVGISAITEAMIESDLATAEFAIEDGEVIVDEGSLGRTVRRPDFGQDLASR